MTAQPDARLGGHWLVAREKREGRDGAFLRLPVDVTHPVRLTLTPLPAVDGLPSVRAEVTNLSPAAVEGELTLLSPVSAGARLDRVTLPFAALAPQETSGAIIPLTAAASPAARYEFALQVATSEGVRDSLSRTLVFAPAPRAAAARAVDGNLDDWPDVFPIEVGLNSGERGDASDGPPRDADDLSAQAALAWDDDNLYIAVRVRDDVHKSDQRDGTLWDGDGLQLGFAPEPYVADSAYYEWGVALTEGGPQAWSWRAPPRQATGEIDFPCRIVRGEGETLYELAVPWKMLAGIEPRAGRTFGFGLCVNEKDTESRGYYGWHAGIASEKDRMRFGQVTLVE